MDVELDAYMDAAVLSEFIRKIITSVIIKTRSVYRIGIISVFIVEDS